MKEITKTLRRENLVYSKNRKKGGLLCSQCFALFVPQLTANRKRGMNGTKQRLFQGMQLEKLCLSSRSILPPLLPFPISAPSASSKIPSDAPSFSPSTASPKLQWRNFERENMVFTGGHPHHLQCSSSLPNASLRRPKVAYYYYFSFPMTWKKK